MAHNENFIQDCIKQRKDILNNPIFKRFSRKYGFKLLIKSTIAFVIMIFLFTLPFDSKNDFVMILGIILFFVSAATFIIILEAILLVLGIKKAETEVWKKENKEHEIRPYIEVERIHNTNLFNLDEFDKCEYKIFRFIFENDKILIYNKNGILLTDSKIKEIKINDKSYSSISQSINGKIESERIDKKFVKIIFDDNRFITFKNISEELEKKLEQLVY